jgi:hypothetical protein
VISKNKNESGAYGTKITENLSRVSSRKEVIFDGHMFDVRVELRIEGILPRANIQLKL